MKDETSDCDTGVSPVREAQHTGKTPVSQGHVSGFVFILLAFILALAAGLRIARISFDSLTFDEQWHLELSTGRGSPHVRTPEDVLIPNAPAVTSLVDAPPWYAVWTNMDFVVHPPLYCTLLRIWREVFGGGDIPARAFSILCTLIAIAFLFLAAREVSGFWAALWAAAIFAVAPTQIFMAQQVRGYDLLLALATAGAYALFRLERSPKPAPRRAACALGFCVLALMLTHYFAIGICAAMGIYVLIRLRGQKLVSAIVALTTAGVVFGIVWGPFLWKQRQNVTGTANPWLIEHSDDHTLLTLGRLATAPLRLIINIPSPPTQAIAGLILVLPMVLLFARRRSDLLLWILWIAGTLFFLTALDLGRETRHLVHTRYLTPAAPAVCMLIAGLFSARSRWAVHVLPVIVVIASICFWRTAYVSEEPNWRALGETLDAHAKSGELIVFYPGLNESWYDEIYYLGAAHYSHGFPRPIVRLSAPAGSELLKQFPGQTLWLVSGRLSPKEPFAPEVEVQKVLPGATILEQYTVPNLAICTRIKLNTSP